MNKEQLIELIKKQYGIDAEQPWMKYPEDMIFRHKDNRKWFALIMTVSRDKIGLEGDKDIDLVNLKCDPMLVDSLKQAKGFYPAYHMNKMHWITVALDGSVEDDKIKNLLDMSFTLTCGKCPDKRGT